MRTVSKPTQAKSPPPQGDDREDYLALVGLSAEDVRREAIVRALRRHGRNTVAAARELGISPAAVIEVVDFGGPRRARPVTVPSDGPVYDDDQHLHLPGRTLAQVEAEALARAIRRHGGSEAEAHAELKLDRS